MKRALIFVLVASVFFPMLIFANAINQDSIVDQYSHKWLGEKVNDLDNFIDKKVFSESPIKENLDEISLANDIKNTKISLRAYRTAIASVILTILVFVIQCYINFRINKDNKKERFENRLHMYLDIYHRNIGKVLMSGVCEGRVAFNFIFYEFEMILNEFIKLKPKAKDGNRLLAYEELCSIVFSFILNGVTRNSKGGERDILYYKYKDILPLDEYENLKEKYVYFRDMTDEKLKSLLDQKEHTLILNFHRIQLEEKKNVQWFWGFRAGFIPYVKTVRSIVDFINQEGPSDKYSNLKYLEASLSEHELAVLYIFAASKENDCIGLNLDSIKSIVEATHLPILYRYDKWDDLKKMLS